MYSELQLQFHSRRSKGKMDFIAFMSSLEGKVKDFKGTSVW